MAQNDNQNQGQDNNPFGHPIKKNNWWLYILGGLCFAGLIIWFFIDWSYKDRNTEDVNIPTEKQIEKATGEPEVALPPDTIVPQETETLPNVTVEDQYPQPDKR